MDITDKDLAMGRLIIQGLVTIMLLLAGVSLLICDAVLENVECSDAGWSLVTAVVVYWLK